MNLINMEKKAKKYRRKSIVVEAFQITDKIYKEIINLEEVSDFECCDSFNTWPKWLQEATYKEVTETGCFRSHYVISAEHGAICVCINTYNDDSNSGLVQPGYWIIQDIKGDLYPLKPDIFQETYEEV